MRHHHAANLRVAFWFVLFSVTATPDARSIRFVGSADRVFPGCHLPASDERFHRPAIRGQNGVTERFVVLSSRNKPFPRAEMPIPTICSLADARMGKQERMTAVQHCHSSAMSRLLPSPAVDLMRTAAGAARLPPGLVIQPGFQPATAIQSNPSQYCVMVYCTHPRLSADQHLGNIFNKHVTDRYPAHR